MNPRMQLLSILVCSIALPLSAADQPTFKTQRLSDKFYGEGAHYADINKDGHTDIVSGPFWYAGPDFSRSYRFYEGDAFDPHAYSKNFLTYTGDINNDGWVDIVVLGFPGEESWWYANPGPKGQEGLWPRYTAIKVTDTESPTFTDITGDGVPEIVCSSGGFFGYAGPDPKNPTAIWTFHKISDKTDAQRFTHGLGVGDVNGDGRMDLLEKTGWWEQPASLEGDPVWKKHPFTFTPHGGAQMYAYDVDGDGLNDVVTSLMAHAYGLVWYKQLRKPDGTISFEDQLIMSQKPEESAGGIVFSQLHAIALADMNGDGLLDIVTGKRWWAHGPSGDPDSDKPAVLYWYELSRKDGRATFIPHRIHDDSGVGTQVEAADINGDGKPDVIVGNKKGTFVHIQQ